jgi:hypothetical protein
MVRRWVGEGAKASLAKTAPSAWGQGYLFETLQVTSVLQAGLAGTNIYCHAGEILALQRVLGGDATCSYALARALSLSLTHQHTTHKSPRTFCQPDSVVCCTQL